MNATVDVPYNVVRWNFTINSGSEEFLPGDQFQVNVASVPNAAFNGKLRYAGAGDFFFALVDDGENNVNSLLFDAIGTGGGIFKVYKVGDPNVWGTFAYDGGGFGVSHAVVLGTVQGGNFESHVPDLSVNEPLIVEFVKSRNNVGPTGPTGPAAQSSVGYANLVNGVATVTLVMGDSDLVFVNRLTDSGTIGCSYSIVKTESGFTVTSRDYLGAVQSADTSTISWMITPQ